MSTGGDQGRAKLETSPLRNSACTTQGVLTRLGPTSPFLHRACQQPPGRRRTRVQLAMAIFPSMGPEMNGSHFLDFFALGSPWPHETAPELHVGCPARVHYPRARRWRVLLPAQTTRPFSSGGSHAFEPSNLPAATGCAAMSPGSTGHHPLHLPVRQFARSSNVPRPKQISI
jgi:hypothetical protein